MGHFENILFDLDGTIIESAPGVTRAVQYSLQQMGIDEPDLKKLEYFVGPPLSESYKDLYGFTDAQCDEAVEQYRVYYSDRGILECAPYDGIPELLRELHDAGRHLAVASSKPGEYVVQILRNLGIYDLFDVAIGPGMGDDLEHKETGNECKARMVRTALEQLSAIGTGDATAMVGDRAFDVLGGIANGVTSVGVVYGYGTRPELEEAGAAHVVDTVAELRTLLLG